MKAKYKVGEMVKTRRRVRPKVTGLVMEVTEPNKYIRMLWDSLEPHYIVKDKKTGEYLSVIERGLERV